MIKTTFKVNEPKHSPGFSLWRAMVVWQRLIKKVLEPYDIPHSQFVILAILLWLEEHFEEPSQISLANMSKLDKMTVSKALKGLEEKRFIMRSGSLKDTRAKTTYLTSKGRLLAQQLVPLVEAADEKFFGILQMNELHHFLEIINKLVVDE